jgi:hypothetical protein
VSPVEPVSPVTEVSPVEPLSPVNRAGPIEPVDGFAESAKGAGGFLDDFGGPIVVAAIAYDAYKIAQLPASQQLPAINQALWSLNGALYGAEAGATVGSIFGPAGTLIGGIVGGLIGSHYGNALASSVNGGSHGVK